MTDENKAVVPPAEATSVVVPAGGDVTKQAVKSQSGNGGAEGGDPKAGQASPNTIEIGEDTYDVDDKGRIMISAQAFKRRLNRYTKNELKAAFGTDDVDDLKSRLDEHGKLKAKSEESRRSQLAKEEQLAEDLRRAKEEAEEARAEAMSLKDARDIHETDSHVRDIASGYVRNAKCAKLAATEFKEYVRELDPKEVDRISDKDIKAWFKDWADENPDFAKTAESTKGNGQEHERRALNVGAGDDQGAKPKPIPAGSGKTAKPGHPNSMSHEEYKAFLKAQGINP